LANLSVHAFNTGDEPVFGCYVASSLDVAGAHRVDQWSIGTLPPRSEMQHPASVEIASDVAFEDIENRWIVSEMTFTDGNGVGWARTHFGLLIEASDPEWFNRAFLSTVMRSRQLKDMWRPDNAGQRRIRPFGARTTTDSRPWWRRWS
jgi:hypothetical protein